MTLQVLTLSMTAAKGTKDVQHGYAMHATVREERIPRILDDSAMRSPAVTDLPSGPLRQMGVVRVPQPPHACCRCDGESSCRIGPLARGACSFNSGTCSCSSGAVCSTPGEVACVLTSLRCFGAAGIRLGPGSRLFEGGCKRKQYAGYELPA